MSYASKEGNSTTSVHLQPSWSDRTSTPRPVPSWHHLVAGASSGVATAVVTSPLDVLRTRLQTDFYRSQRTFPPGPLPHRVIPGVGSFWAVSLDRIRGSLRTIASVQRAEGWRGLYRGLGPSLVGVVPATAVKFYTYGNCKHAISTTYNRSMDDVVVLAASAAAAGIATATVTNPIWVLKTRLQLDHSTAHRRYYNTWDCLLQIIQKEGLKGLYRGLSASYLGIVESTLHLVLYERIKLVSAKQRQRESPSRHAGWVSTSIAAGASKLVAALVAYPHEVIRTRLRQAPLPTGGFKYTGIVQCFTLVWREEGIRGLYGGLTPHLLRAIPSAAITLSVYEMVLGLLHQDDK